MTMYKKDREKISIVPNLALNGTRIELGVLIKSHQPPRGGHDKSQTTFK